MAETLDPEGAPIALDDVLLSTPGLTGQAELYQPGVPGMRAEEETAGEFFDALATTDFVEQFTVVITDQAELNANGGSRAGGGGDDITIQVPGPGSSYAQVLLYTAEDGTQTWHLEELYRPHHERAAIPARQPRNRHHGRRANTAQACRARSGARPGRTHVHGPERQLSAYQAQPLDCAAARTVLRCRLQLRAAAGLAAVASCQG